MLRAPLFHRQNRRLMVTDAKAAWYCDVREAMASLDAAVGTFSEGG